MAKSVLKGFWICVLICCLGSVARAQVPDTVRVQILHSNDVYGQLLGSEVNGHQWGGMASRVRLIRTLRKAGPTLVLDAGDALGPGTLSAWIWGRR